MGVRVRARQGVVAMNDCVSQLWVAQVKEGVVKVKEKAAWVVQVKESDCALYHWQVERW